MARRRLPRKYLIDILFPAGEFHIIAGPSGGGKTRQIIQLILDWQAGRPVFGHESHPEPYLYISRDRGVMELLDTLEGLGVDPDAAMESGAFEFLSLLDSTRYGEFMFDFAGLVRKLAVDLPGTKVLFVDGLAMMAPAGFRSIDYQNVSRYASMISRMCHELGVTIVGIMHSPKCKEGERYASPRQRISGSVAWGAICSTVMLVEEPEERIAKADPAKRVLTFDVRNGPRETFKLRFTPTGRLELDTTDEPGARVEASETVRATDKLNAWYTELAPGATFTAEDFEELWLRLMISRATAFRWLQDNVVACRVEKLSRGLYRKPIPQ